MGSFRSIGFCLFYILLFFGVWVVLGYRVGLKILEGGEERGWREGGRYKRIRFIGVERG